MNRYRWTDDGARRPGRIKSGAAWHPDRANGDAERFKGVSEAYDVLSEAKRHVDRGGGGLKAGFVPPEAQTRIVGSIWGGGGVGVGSRAVGSRMETRGAGITGPRARTRRVFSRLFGGGRSGGGPGGFPVGADMFSGGGGGGTRSEGRRSEGRRSEGEKRATVQRRRARCRSGIIQRRDEGVRASERARGESRANGGERRTRVRGRQARVARRDANPHANAVTKTVVLAEAAVESSSSGVPRVFEAREGRPRLRGPLHRAAERLVGWKVELKNVGGT